MRTSKSKRNIVWFGVAVAIVAAGLAARPRAQLAETIIRNGLIVTVEGRAAADLRIQGETITEIGRNLRASPGAREIDASGKLIFPGGVDPHTHMSGVYPAPPLTNQDDYVTGSQMAFAGGVTTLTNMLGRQANEPPDQYFERLTRDITTNASADIAPHVQSGSDPAWLTPILPKMVERGIASTKTFISNAGFDANSLAFLKFFRASGQAGVVSMVHAEDYAMSVELGEKLIAEGHGTLHNIAQSRPAIVETIATQRAVAIAELTGAPMYLVHLSARRALQVAEEAMKRGVPVYVETRPIYLHFTQERYHRPDYILWGGDPPLREKADVEALWDGIARGVVHAVGTDHVGFTYEAKLNPEQTVVTKRAGLTQLQVYRPMLYSEGVEKGRITLEQFVEVSATNPAKIFGLYPKKGTIQVGSDADVVIWDPELTRKITVDEQLARAKYSVYEGWEVKGWPITTIRRGEIVFQNGKVTAKPGTGKLLRQERWTRPVLRIRD